MTGYVISGFVRRGGGRAQRAHWTGKSWAKSKAMIYPNMREAERARDLIDIRLVESMAVYPAPADWIPRRGTY